MVLLMEFSAVFWYSGYIRKSYFLDASQQSDFMLNSITVFIAAHHSFVDDGVGVEPKVRLHLLLRGELQLARWALMTIHWVRANRHRKQNKSMPIEQAVTHNHLWISSSIGGEIVSPRIQILALESDNLTINISLIRGRLVERQLSRRLRLLLLRLRPFLLESPVLSPLSSSGKSQYRPQLHHAISEWVQFRPNEFQNNFWYNILVHHKPYMKSDFRSYIELMKAAI